MQLPPVPHAITPEPLTAQPVVWFPSISLPHSLFLSVSTNLGTFIFLFFFLFSYTAPPCLVRGQLYHSCQTPETYTLSLPYMGRGIFFPKGTLACYCNVLAAPNILHKIYSILFLTYMTLWCLTWHPSVTCLHGIFPFVSLLGNLLNRAKTCYLSWSEVCFLPAEKKTKNCAWQVLTQT